MILWKYLWSGRWQNRWKTRLQALTFIVAVSYPPPPLIHWSHINLAISFKLQSVYECFYVYYLLLLKVHTDLNNISDEYKKINHTEIYFNSFLYLFLKKLFPSFLGKVVSTIIFNMILWQIISVAMCKVKNHEFTNVLI